MYGRREGKSYLKDLISLTNLSCIAKKEMKGLDNHPRDGSKEKKEPLGELILGERARRAKKNQISSLGGKLGC